MALKSLRPLVRPWLIIPVGIPGCGKSTFGQRLENRANTNMIQRGVIRSMFGEYTQAKERCVVQAMKAFTQGRLLDGQNVYVDCCNIDQYSRAQYRDWCAEVYLMRRIPVRRMYVVFKCRVGAAVARRKRGPQAVPEDFIRKQHAALDPPKPKEHLGRIVVVGGLLRHSAAIIEIEAKMLSAGKPAVE